MRLARILLVILLIGLVVYAAFSLMPKSESKSSKPVVIKPSAKTTKTSAKTTATSSFLTLSICGYKLQFTASSLVGFEVRNCIAHVVFEGDLRLGPGTYKLYNASRCHISGYFDVLGYGNDYIVINVKKYVIVRNCGKVAIRPGG